MSPQIDLPQHIAVVMDGNGRWAKARGKARSSGHKAGLKAVRLCIQECVKRSVGALTLFAFSSENWQRSEIEVVAIMGLFFNALESEIKKLNTNNVRIRIIGNRQRLTLKLQQRIAQAEARTAENTGLNLQIAVSYGGRWDVVEATRVLASRCVSGDLRADDIDEVIFSKNLQLAGLSDPDLFIRTGGERRISNFLLWNIAYTELHFSDVLWPDFAISDFDLAMNSFSSRQRRFGLVSP